MVLYVPTYNGPRTPYELTESDLFFNDTHLITHLYHSILCFDRLIKEN